MQIDPQVLNATGLVLDILGALLLWKFGLPVALARDGGEFLWSQPTPEGKSRAKWSVRLSNIGIGAIVVGFALQLVSSFISPV